MKPIPWRFVKSWNCIVCGICCKDFDVVLGYKEWLDIIRRYGIEVTYPGVTKLYLQKKSNGCCIFLNKFQNMWLCSLQNTKPKACKLWPFKIYNNPKYGRSNKALCNFQGKKLYIYVDPLCPGIKWGIPSKDFMNGLLKEFIEIALGFHQNQYYSTAQLHQVPSQNRNIFRRKF